jgi:hypothetical protein
MAGLSTLAQALERTFAHNMNKTIDKKSWREEKETKYNEKIRINTSFGENGTGKEERREHKK